MLGFAQSVPQGINYQAVARDANGDVLMNQNLTIQFSVISDIATSAVSWQETHQDTTNAYGLFTAIIGQGAATSGGSSATFDVIDWGASNHLLKVEVDYGNGYLDMGTTAFMSVPYALFGNDEDADSTNELQSLLISGDTLFISNSNFIVLPTQTLLGCMDSTASNYSALANTDDGSCFFIILGCTDATAINHNSSATFDNGSCIAVVNGCMDSTAFNYNISANISDSSCIPFIYGCTDSTAFNYVVSNNTDDGSCIAKMLGCMDTIASNYDSLANIDNSLCSVCILALDTNTSFSFTKLNGAQWTLASNRDSITPSCVLTRQSSNGLYNYATQTDVSDTANTNIEYAMGTHENYTSPWYTTFKDLKYHTSCSGMYCLSGHTITIHILDDDLYFELEFTSWSSGGMMGNGGGFSYTRTAVSCNEAPLVYGCTEPTASNFLMAANFDDGNCIINGCTDSLSCNFNPIANLDDGTCLTTYGCTDSLACNYDSLATCEDGSCLTAWGCTDSGYSEYDASATCDDGSCVTSCVFGCTSIASPNYDSLATCEDGSCLIVGSTYQGGLIFWLNGSGGGLISATSNLSSAQYGCSGTYVGASGTAIGSGAQNTYNIVGGCSANGTAADLCANYDDGTYNDWFLPSSGELMRMYTSIGQGSSLGNIGGFSNYPYWSSTENSSYSDRACTQNFGNAYYASCYSFKSSGSWSVRAIREFGANSTILNGCTTSTACNYNPAANFDDGSCNLPNGCGNALYIEYDVLVTCSDASSCINLIINGCTDSTATNYNSSANTDNGSCIVVVNGCTDTTACNFDALANISDSSCTYAGVNADCSGCLPGYVLVQGSGNGNGTGNGNNTGQCVPEVLGCMDTTACNYSASANVNDNTCSYITSLLTTLTGGNGSNGNMFNITNTSNSTVYISGFSQGPGHANQSVQNVEVKVYSMPAAYVVNSLLWTQVGSVVTNLTSGSATGYCSVSGVSIPAGSTYGFYVGLTLGTVQYTDGTGTAGVSPLSSDNNITITEGLGGPYPNPTYYPRNWNGKVHYSNSAVCIP